MSLNGKLIKRRDIHMENISETKKRLTIPENSIRSLSKNENEEDEEPP
jgi:hypothetical protein